jgi:hypothetical protein
MIVTEHAIERYRERIRSVEDPASEIQHAMIHGFLFSCRSADGHLTLTGLVNRRGYPFVAAWTRRDGDLVCETVGQTYHWHETKQWWRRYASKQSVKAGPSAIRRELNAHTR